MTLPAGAKLGRYEIRSKIGEGGMGEVYRAFDPKINRGGDKDSAAGTKLGRYEIRCHRQLDGRLKS